MPIESQYAAEGLKPSRLRETLEKTSGSTFKDNRPRDLTGK